MSSFENNNFDPQMNIDLQSGDNMNYGNQQNKSGYNNEEENRHSKPFVEDQEPGSSTLDEPISKTILRDLKMIYEKVKISMLPFKATKEAKNKLKEWDFWGPLIFCFLLGIILSIGRETEQTGIIFILVFAIVWVGGLIVSLNSQFLGIKLSIYQCISILGYCMFAIVVVAFVNLLTGFLPIIFRILFSLFGFVYSSYASVAFIGSISEGNKKILVAYPVFLFYLFLAWFTITK